MGVDVFEYMESIIISDLNHIEAAARQFLESLNGRRIVAFYGSMGVGKTTFIKALCRVLNVEDVVNSPTFTIVNEYMTSDGLPVYHFDFYRIESVSEVENIGFSEYVYGEGLSLMEWPEMIEEILPEDTVRVRIEEMEGGIRVINFI